ncbi:MlaD family protein [Nocardioides ultimimeridianus]
MNPLGSLSRKTVALSAVAVLLVVLALAKVVHGSPYTVSLLMPSADQAFAGGRVVMRGQTIGHVDSIGVQDGKALVKVDIDDAFAPLPSGTFGRIKWESVLGARIVELVPGPADGAPIPSGKLITGNDEAVDLDDLFSMLDAKTRKNLGTLVVNLNSTLAGKPTQKTLNATLREAGPTFKALLELLRGVGEDGPALRRLVTQLHGVTSVVASRDVSMVRTVNNLNRLTTAVAARQAQLSRTIALLPGTVSQANTTLGHVPGAVTSARELLRALKPSTAQLPQLARYAKPVLVTAKPLLAMLPSTLKDADTLFKYTPGLVRDANATLPSVTTALRTLNPMVSYLRPYTPELVGWLSNWNGVFGSRDAAGHYARALITASASSLDNNPGIMPPGMQQDARPQPGSIAGQTWTDANGDGVS